MILRAPLNQPGGWKIAFSLFFKDITGHFSLSCSLVPNLQAQIHQHMGEGMLGSPMHCLHQLTSSIPAHTCNLITLETETGSLLKV